MMTLMEFVCVKKILVVIFRCKFLTILYKIKKKKYNVHRILYITVQSQNVFVQQTMYIQTDYPHKMSLYINRVHAY